MREKQSNQPQPRKEPIQYGRVLLSASDLSFSTSGKRLFVDVSLVVRKGENIALTGESGSGKSVLLNVLSGKLLPETGTIETARDIRIGYIPQRVEELGIDPDITIADLFYKARGLDDVVCKKSELEKKMAEGEGDLTQTLEKYQETLDEYEHRGGYASEAQMGEILSGLKMDERSTGNISTSTRLSEVSSGQRTKLLIGQALFARPDLLILDDPSSHLDVQSTLWLAQYLKKSDQAAIVATNNLDFIDTFANKVFEITQIGRVLSFEGNYRDFISKRDQLLDAEIKAAKHKQDDIDRIKGTISYFKSRGINRRSADMAAVVNALESRVERAERELQEMPGSQPTKRLERVSSQSFESSQRSGNDVALIRKVQKKYGDNLALNLSGVDITIRRGEKFIVLGSNGSGKSTLLRMIGMKGQDSFEPSRGSLMLGANVEVGYYAPDHEDISEAGKVFDDAKSVIDTNNEGRVSAVLAYWGFSREEIRRKTIRELSKGERTQLSLAKLMLKKPNVLVLDEPTNNLRPEMIERLIASLEKYDGTVILVSHDPSFVSRLKASRTLHLPRGDIELN